MLSTLGVIDACFDEEAQRRRAARRVSGKAVLEWVVRRATEAQQLDGVIVLSRECPENRALLPLIPPDVPVFFGKQADVLGCWMAALAEYPCRSAVRIETSSPLLDPTLVDRLVSEANARVAGTVDYLGFMQRNGKPAHLSCAPLCGEWFTSEALRRAARQARGRKQRSDPTVYMLSQPQRFRLEWIPLPDAIDRDDFRLTLENEDDREHIEVIFDVLGPDCDWRRISELLDRCPVLRRDMATQNQDRQRR